MAGVLVTQSGGQLVPQSGGQLVRQDPGRDHFPARQFPTATWGGMPPLLLSRDERKRNGEVPDDTGAAIAMLLAKAGGAITAPLKIGMQRWHATQAERAVGSYNRSVQEMLRGRTVAEVEAGGLKAAKAFKQACTSGIKAGNPEWAQEFAAKAAQQMQSANVTGAAAGVRASMQQMAHKLSQSIKEMLQSLATALAPSRPGSAPRR